MYYHYMKCRCFIVYSVEEFFSTHYNIIILLKIYLIILLKNGIEKI